MSSNRFDDDDVRALRAQLMLQPSKPERPIFEEATTPVGLVQLNVRVRPEVKQVIVERARQREIGIAQLIEELLGIDQP